MKDIEYTLSPTDIADVRKLLNEFLKHISLVPLSRYEVDIVDLRNKCAGSSDSRCSNIVEVINRWGIKEKEGKYYKLLNDVIGRISSCHPMLLIYKPIKFLLFNKLLEGWSKGGKAEFTQEEIEIFFLQTFKMIISKCLPESAIYLYDLITESYQLSAKLKLGDAREFLDQGVGRRLFMLKANVDSISKIYNEHRIKVLDDNENAILSQNTNFFYANLYAILDCLAFVFAFEYTGYKIQRNNKHQYKNVGLFNEKFYQEIAGLDDKLNLIKLKSWYNEIADLRHPIAHRIPLYFPEIYLHEDALKIKEIRDEYSRKFNATFKNRKVFSDDEKDQISKQMDESNKLNDAINKLREDRQKAESYINVFSGCFLHSDQESKRYYHLSRLIFDLGILYYLLDKSFEYLCEICS